MDTVYPFIPMYPTGQPQGNFLVNGLSAPVLIPKRAASSVSYTHLDVYKRQVDVCAEALEVARFRFHCAWLAAGGKGDFRDHLLCGDSLDMSCLLYTS